MSKWTCFAGGAIVIAVCGLIGIAGDEASTSRSRETSRKNDFAALAASVDKHIADRWVKENVTPAAACDDATYLRRVYLDVTGRIPPYAEVEEFLADATPDKRARVVDRLLEGPTYVAERFRKVAGRSIKAPLEYEFNWIS